MRKLLIVVVALAAVAYLVMHPPDFIERLRYPLPYRAIVVAHAHNDRLDPAVLAAVIYPESKFRPDAISSSGAVGLMQLLPSTAEGIAIHTGGSKFRTSDLLDPELNIRYGCWYLRHLLDKYDDERTALAAYNAGQENVVRWKAAGIGIQFAETRAYVDRVEHLKGLYRRLYGLTPT